MFRLRYTGRYHEHNRYTELELMQNVHGGGFLWKPGVLPRVIIGFTGAITHTDKGWLKQNAKANTKP